MKIEYNLTELLVKKHSSERIEQLSQAKLGTHHTEEVKAKISKTKTGRIFP